MGGCHKNSARRGVHGCLGSVQSVCNSLFILLKKSAGVVPTHVGGSEDSGKPSLITMSCCCAYTSRKR